MSKITKQYQVKQSGGWWIASTPNLDRQKDRVFPLGLDLSNYRRNPVLMWAHDYKSPYAVIGQAVDLEVTATDFRVRPKWRKPANDADPMTIIQALLDQGLVKAMSIGFNPVDSVPNQAGGYDFLAADLLEVSLCPVPANAEALQLAVKALTGDPGTSPTRQQILDYWRARGLGKLYSW